MIIGVTLGILVTVGDCVGVIEGLGNGVVVSVADGLTVGATCATAWGWEAQLTSPIIKNNPRILSSQIIAPIISGFLFPRTGRLARKPVTRYNPDHSGRGAARLARLHGVQEVGGSNPLAPTEAYPQTA